MSKKIVSALLTLTTIVWLSGLAMFVPTAQAVTINEGDLIRGPDGIKVYIVNDKGYKRHIFNPAVFEMYKHFSWDSIKSVSQDVLDSYITSDLYRADGDPKVYSLEEIDSASGNAVKHWLDMTAEQFVSEGYSWDQVFIVNATERDYYTTGDPLTVGGTTPSAGTVAVQNVSGGNMVVPLYATGVEVMKFNVTANGATTLNSLTLVRKGVGSYSDFEYLYVYEGANRLSNGKSIGSTDHSVTFSNLGIALSAGQTKTLTIKADMDTSGAGSGNINYFELTSVGVSSGTVSGLSISGPQINIASSSAATLTIATGGTPSNPSVGSDDAVLAKFRIHTIANENVKLHQVTLTNSGSVDLKNITDWGLYYGNDLLANGEVSGEHVNFVLDEPYLMEKGASRYFDVKGDIGASAKASQTLRLYLEETTDLLCIGQSYGYGAKVTNSYTSSSGSTELTLQGGDLTVSFDGPTASTLAQGSEDATWFEFSLTAQQNVTVRNLYGNFYHSSDITAAYSNNYITDIKVVDKDTGTTILGPVDISAFTDGGGAYAYYTFTEDFDLNAGETRRFKVTADLNSSLAAGTYYFKLGSVSGGYIFSSTDVKSRDASGEYITNIVPATTIQGHNMTVAAAALTVSLASTPVTANYVKGTQNVEAVGFLLTAGAGSSVNISSIKVAAYVDANEDDTFAKYTETGSSSAVTARELLSSISLWDGSTQLGSTKTINTSGEATFSSLNWTLPAGTTKKLVVKANISTNAPIDGSLDRIKIDIADVSDDITATDASGNAVSSGSSDYPNGSATAATSYLVIRSAGTLYAEAAADMPTAAIVLSGSSDVTFAKFKFSSNYEAFNVERVAIDNASANYDDNISAVILSYPDQNGNTVTKTGYLSSGQVIFDNLSPAFYVPKDGSAYLTVKANLAQIGGSGGADSGDVPQFTLGKDRTNDDQFKAVGVGSGTTLDDEDVYFSGSQSTDTIDGNAMTVRKAKPTITANALPTSSLTDGTHTIYSFTVANTSNEAAEIGLKKFGFDVVLSDNNTSTALTLDTVKIYKSTDLTNNIAATIEDGSGNDLTGTGNNLTNGTGSILVKFTSEQSIAAGSSVTYLLKARITGSAQYDSITTSLKAPAQSTVYTEYLDAATNTLLVLDTVQDGTGTEYNGHMIWSDKSAGTSHSASETASSKDWTTGYQVQTLPSDAKSLSR